MGTAELDGFEQPRHAAYPLEVRGPTTVTPTGARMAGEEEFRGWEPLPAGPRSVLDGLPGATSRREVASVIDQIIATEGPVHEERLVRLVAAAFDLSKVNGGRATAILRCVPAGRRMSKESTVVWDGRTDPSSWRAYRRDPDGTRDIEHVPLRELANSMRSLCRASGGTRLQRGD